MLTKRWQSAGYFAVVRWTIGLIHLALPKKRQLRLSLAVWRKNKCSLNCWKCEDMLARCMLNGAVRTVGCLGSGFDKFMVIPWMNITLNDLKWCPPMQPQHEWSAQPAADKPLMNRGLLCRSPINSCICFVCSSAETSRMMVFFVIWGAGQKGTACGLGTTQLYIRWVSRF